MGDPITHNEGKGFIGSFSEIEVFRRYDVVGQPGFVHIRPLQHITQCKDHRDPVNFVLCTFNRCFEIRQPAPGFCD